MPPSGFNETHSFGISTFLKNCLHDLIAENNGVRNAPAALDRELAHIEQDQRENKRSIAATAALDLVKDLYSRIRKILAPSHTAEDLEELGEGIIAQICAEIEAIQIIETI